MQFNTVFSWSRDIPENRIARFGIFARLWMDSVLEMNIIPLLNSTESAVSTAKQLP
jgi:hypothetical protein